MVTWSTDSAISSATEKTKFAITDTKLYVPIVMANDRISISPNVA